MFLYAYKNYCDNTQRTKQLWKQKANIWLLIQWGHKKKILLHTKSLKLNYIFSLFVYQRIIWGLQFKRWYLYTSKTIQYEMWCLKLQLSWKCATKMSWRQSVKFACQCWNRVLLSSQEVISVKHKKASNSTLLQKSMPLTLEYPKTI